MKISESGILNIQKPQSDKVYEPVTTGAGTTSTARSSQLPADRVDLASQSGLVAQAQQGDSIVRQQRIDQLRALVQSGQYHVDSVSLSSAIISATIDGD